MKIKFESIAQFIDTLKRNDKVIGILEYGGRKYDDMAAGGDYDLTVITRTPISKNIGGLHFHIAGIPVDCMLKSVDDFLQDEPSSEFELAHLNSKILFDRDGTIQKLLQHINGAWGNCVELSARDIDWFRFTFKHIIDKLEYRLNDDKLYSNYFMSASMDWFIECYAKIKGLEIGKPKQHFQYINKNDPVLYCYLQRFFDTVDVDEHFSLLRLCAEYITKDIGGLWRDDEVIFHLNADNVSQSEKDDCWALFLIIAKP